MLRGILYTPNSNQEALELSKQPKPLSVIFAKETYIYTFFITLLLLHLFSYRQPFGYVAFTLYHIVISIVIKHPYCYNITPVT